MIMRQRIRPALWLGDVAAIGLYVVNERLSARRRRLLIALRCLTRVHVRSVEQPVNLDDRDDVFD